METLFVDIKQAFRLLIKNPGFTLVAVAALALGIGANTGIFSVVDKVLLQPLPYPQPEKIVQLGRKYPNGEGFSNSITKYNTWRNNQTVFSAMAIYDQEGPGLNISSGERPEQIKGMHVSADFFKVFGIGPARGRTFSKDEDLPKGPNAAVISDHLWESHFARDPNMLSRVITLNGEPYPVIGIMPPSYVASPAAEVWIPLQADPNSDNQGHYLAVAARLKDGVPLDQARAQMKLAGEVFRRANPKFMDKNESVAVVAMGEAQVRNVRLALLILLGAVVVVLLIACANVANLLLARAAARQRELSIRAALGASRGRVIRQLLTESVILAGIGGVLGLFLGGIGVRALLLLKPVNIPRLADTSELQSAFAMIDWRIALFTVALSVLTGIVFGLVPALQISKPDIAGTLKDAAGRSSTGARRHGFVRKLLVASEMGLAVVLLISAMLLIRSFVGLSNVNSGIDPHHVLTMLTSLAGERYATTEKVDNFTTQVLRRVEALPGVESASISIALPLTNEIDLPINIAGKPPKSGDQYNGDEQWRSISPHYFATFKIPSQTGRIFTERDTLSSAKVVVINRAMAKKYWKNENPIGQVITIGKGLGPLEDQPREIVGIVGDVRETGAADSDVPVMYIPMSQQQQGLTALANSAIPLSWSIRSHLDAKTLGAEVLKEMQAVDGQMPVAKVRTMEQVLTEQTSQQDFNMLLLTIFAVVALVLAAIGIYGLMSYSVEQQTSELGIRMALGAAKVDLFRLVVKQGMTPALIGVACGLGLAFFATQLMKALLFGVQTYDPLSFIAVAVVLTAVALVSIYLPARRAMGLDPLIALRQE
jgi:putative ABC transport system permease protein